MLGEAAIIVTGAPHFRQNRQAGALVADVLQAGYRLLNVLLDDTEFDIEL